MPKRTDIKKILLIGSGPIVIGQGCEFDYSGVQACKALREEGYEVVLVNSNPATIMHNGITDERFARRRDILGTVDEHFRTLEKSDALTAMDSFYQSAYALVSSKEAREAFNLSAEPDAIRNEYGMERRVDRMVFACRFGDLIPKAITIG